MQEQDSSPVRFPGKFPNRHDLLVTGTVIRKYLQERTLKLGQGTIPLGKGESFQVIGSAHPHKRKDPERSSLRQILVHWIDGARKFNDLPQVQSRVMAPHKTFKFPPDSPEQQIRTCGAKNLYHIKWSIDSLHSMNNFYPVQVVLKVHEPYNFLIRIDGSPYSDSYKPIYLDLRILRNNGLLMSTRPSRKYPGDTFKLIRPTSPAKGMILVEEKGVILGEVREQIRMINGLVLTDRERHGPDSRKRKISNASGSSQDSDSRSFWRNLRFFPRSRRSSNSNSTSSS